MGPSRSILNACLNAQSRQCRRFLSSAQSSVVRRAAAANNARTMPQFAAQRRTYKTVEEAKSRYKSGVCQLRPSPRPAIILRDVPRWLP